MATITTEREAVSIEVKDLSKRYGEQVVLDGVSFDVEPGEIFVIMGPSGAGKSVLLRNIVGLELPDQGSIHLNGLDASQPETHRTISSALVFQAGALFNSLSVFDNLAFYPREHRLYDKKTLREKVERTLEILNIADAARKQPSELSGGMRKRVAIARALVMEPQLLLYDEPTSELDPVTAANITEIIGTLREEYNVTSVVVSHDRDLALSVAQRVALLNEGKIIAMDSPDQLKQSDDQRVQEFLNPKIDIEKPRFRNERI